jgi:membrane protease YdiL (CAAX protease family)
VNTVVSPARLTLWALFVLALGGLNLASREASGKPDDDLLYQWGTAIGGVVLYAIVLGVVLLIARGLDWRHVFALRRPPSIRSAIGWVFMGLVAIGIVNSVLSQFLDAGKDQGLVPDRWEPTHAAAFVANFVVVAGVAPVVEELVFRGFGVTAISSYVAPAATVLWVGIAFGAWHGLVIAFPALATLGAIFALVRLQTNSVYPTMVMHALFNATALIVAVTFGVGS